MKKFIFIMPLMVVSFLVNCGNNNPKPDPIDPAKIDLYKKEMIYNTEATSISETIEYEYNDKKLKTKETHTWPNDEDITYITYEYDEHDNETKATETRYIAGDEPYTIEYKHDFIYDKEGRPTSIDIYNGWFDSKERQEFIYEKQLTTEMNYEYDESEGEYILASTKYYKYDNQNRLINIKEKPNYSSNDTETEFTLDKNGCATTIKQYHVDGDNRELFEEYNIEYLDNLWYRPLKDTITDYNEDYQTTIEREYDENNRITLYKHYMGTDETAIDNYIRFVTYEY